MSDSADQAVVATPHAITVDFFSRKGNREEILINSTDPTQQLEGKSRWFTYAFARPVYLTKIEVKTDGYSSYDKFEVIVDHVDGTTHDEKIPLNVGSVSLRLGKMCNGFRFKPPSKIIADTKLLSVIATGFTEEEFHRLEWAIKEYEKKAAEQTAREAKLAEATEEFAELTAERVELEGAVGRAKAELDQLQKSISSGTERMTRQKEQEAQLQKSVSDANERLSNVVSEVERETTKRDALIREVRLFPSEIAGFVKEGNRSIKWYLGIGAPFALILAIILVKLFSNAVDLTQLYKTDPNIDIWTIFLTRLPFVIVALALVEACGYIVGRLVFEIIRINRQRLEFAKLSIIAKDVSTAAASVAGEVSDDDIFDRETKLKMELLREHMKNFVGNEFEYRGTGLIAAIKGVADRFGKPTA